MRGCGWGMVYVSGRSLMVLVGAAMFVLSVLGGSVAFGRQRASRRGRQVLRSTYVVSAEYKGTYHFEDHQSFQGEKYDAVETFKWDAVGALTVRGDTGAVLGSRFTLTASGRLYLNSSNGGKPIIEDCTFKRAAGRSAEVDGRDRQHRAARVGSSDQRGQADRLRGRLPDARHGRPPGERGRQERQLQHGHGRLDSAQQHRSRRDGRHRAGPGAEQPLAPGLRLAGLAGVARPQAHTTGRRRADRQQRERDRGTIRARCLDPRRARGMPGPTTPAKPPAKKPCTPISGNPTPLNQVTASEYLRKLASWIERYGNGLQARIPYLPPDWQKFAKDELITSAASGSGHLRFGDGGGGLPPPPPPPDPPGPDDSVEDVEVPSSPDVVNAQSPGRPSSPYSTTTTLTQAGIAALRSGKPLTVTLKGVFRLKGKPPITATTTITFKGRRIAATPTISSVTFGGDVQNPSIVIHGTNLGGKPAPNPAGSPSNQPLCPVTIQGNAGLDYGTSLYLDDTTGNWAAGRYRPSASELDCIGLIVTKFTATEVDFRLGSGYQQVYPKLRSSPRATPSKSPSTAPPRPSTSNTAPPSPAEPLDCQQPLRCGNPTLGRFDSGAAPLSRFWRVHADCRLVELPDRGA